MKYCHTHWTNEQTNITDERFNKPNRKDIHNGQINKMDKRAER